MFFPLPAKRSPSSTSLTFFQKWRQRYSMKSPRMLCFANFLLSVLLFAARQNDSNASNLVPKTFPPFWSWRGFKFLKKREKVPRTRFYCNILSRLLDKTYLPFDFITCESHRPCGMAWLQFTLCVSNICIRKPQQLKNSHVILLSLGGTW